MTEPSEKFGMNTAPVPAARRAGARGRCVVRPARRADEHVEATLDRGAHDVDRDWGRGSTTRSALSSRQVALRPEHRDDLETRLGVDDRADDAAELACSGPRGPLASCCLRESCLQTRRSPPRDTLGAWSPSCRLPPMIREPSACSPTTSRCAPRRSPPVRRTSRCSPRHPSSHRRPESSSSRSTTMGATSDAEDPTHRRRAARRALQVKHLY